MIDPLPLTARTNIWAIGAVLSRLMQIANPERNHDKQPIWLADGALEDTLYPLEIPDNDLTYGRGLKQLVNRCLSFDPTLRPTADGLRTLIRDATAEPRLGVIGETPDRAKGLRSGAASLRTVRENAVFLPRDLYAYQLTQDRLPSRNAGVA